MLVDERFADCFDGNPDFDEIIVAKRKFTTALRLMVRRFNLIINLHGGPWVVASTLELLRQCGFEIVEDDVDLLDGETTLEREMLVSLG